MYIQYTHEAVDEITKKLAGRSGRIKLEFDSEGCGCSVSGVPTLWLVNESSEHDLKAEGDPYETFYDRKQEVFFEEKMKINYNVNTQAFSLTSNSQIYNQMMSLIDKR